MTVMLGFATVTLPSVLIAGYYLFQADDEEREQYLDAQHTTIKRFVLSMQILSILFSFSFG